MPPLNPSLDRERENRNNKERNMFTPEELEKIKNDAIAAVQKDLVESIRKSARCAAEDTVSRAVRETIKKWVTDEIAPEIAKSLVDAKDGVVSAGVEAAKGIAETLAKAMTSHLAEMMETNYKRDELLNAIFGKRF